MFEPTSRYYALPTARWTLPDGRVVTYKRRRFVPDGTTLPLLGEVAPAPGERLDLLTARVLGDPEQFWRIADANDAMQPADLLDPPDRLLRVPQPQG